MARIKTATRTVSNAGRLVPLAIVSSGKGIGELVAESLSEYHGLVDMCFDNDIESIQVQPEVFELKVRGQLSRYTPDARFVRRDGRIGFREFKADKTKLTDEEIEKYEAAAAYFEARGFEYSIVDLKDLGAPYRPSNIRLLRRYADSPTSTEVTALVTGHLRGQPLSVLNELRLLVGPGGLRSLYRMLWEQRVGLDITSGPLSGMTRVWRLP
jgi:hypothetical protein